MAYSNQKGLRWQQQQQLPWRGIRNWLIQCLNRMSKIEHAIIYLVKIFECKTFLGKLLEEDKLDKDMWRERRVSLNVNVTLMIISWRWSNKKPSKECNKSKKSQGRVRRIQFSSRRLTRYYGNERKLIVSITNMNISLSIRISPTFIVNGSKKKMSLAKLKLGDINSADSIKISILNYLKE